MATAWVKYSINRGPIHGTYKNRFGLTLRIEGNAELENYIKTNSVGEPVDISMYGDNWVNMDNPNKRFFVYPIQNMLGNGYILGDGYVGQPLIAPQHDDLGRINKNRDLVNLSFLQLAGISEGISLGIVGPHSLDFANKLKTMLPTTTRQFAYDYIVPISINLEIYQKS